MNDPKNADKSWETNKKQDVVIEEIREKQNNDFRNPGIRNRWRLEKEWKPLIANKNLLVDALRYDRFAKLYSPQGSSE